ncbi:YybH family protein [Aquimarina mytili]|uniref:DUF4440 domain-containing protein n=1 Tax=Aquimarina mytili TaxID=874423 RepID=A0A937DAD6_9FLAO|nr:hypothetical protein [Aquimarina mytili]MBL0682586.1 hypothetical protein [Aquimarina mytili]
MKPLLLALLLCIGCSQNPKKSLETSKTEDEKAINTINQNYIEGWKNMNEELIMSLFEDGARIQPNSLKPFENKENIRKFWFPKDSSITTIHNFELELLHLTIKDSIATTLQESLIDWSYQKDTIHMAMIQKGINTTVYRKQQDHSWKIWRKMWTDIYIEKK